VIQAIRSGRNDASEGQIGLSAIRARLAAASAGEGGVVYVEGPRASGKSELLAAAAEAGQAAEMRVLHARGRDLERGFPFGMAIQLFEEAWYAAGAPARAIWLDGPARAAGALLSGDFLPEPDLAGARTYAVIHGLFWLARAVAGDGPGGEPGRPLAVIVDDVDCADEASLRFFAYLAPRIGRLPIALILAASGSPLSMEAPALSAVRSASELVGLAPAGPRLSAVADTAPARLSLVEPASADGPRAAAAQIALRKSLADAHRESVLDLAELAWGDGAMLESDEDADAWPLVADALLFVDELERAVEIAQAGARLGRPDARAGAAHGWSLYHQGRITEACDVAEAALAADGAGAAVRGLMAACHLAQGKLDEAEALLAGLSERPDIEDISAPVLLDLRAQLRLAQMRPADALADALEAGQRCRRSSGRLGPGVVAWRSTAALARLALGENERARALAEEELELARERGLRRVVIRDLRVLALAAQGTRTLDLLSEAVRVGRAAPPRLEYVHALLDLGAATRRANQRTAARHPLRSGLELAEQGGATALAGRAREELDATGARSRRVMLSGVEALTASERRVAELAVAGLTTRQIAQALFVTPKTVEFHLRHVYRKLDIPSARAELVRAMSSPSAG
jgi:DNA-binding CsgD family transcriptional regulator